MCAMLWQREQTPSWVSPFVGPLHIARIFMRVQEQQYSLKDKGDFIVLKGA